MSLSYTRHHYNDSVIKVIKRESEDTLSIVLDCSGTFSEFDKLEVTL